MKWGGLNSGSNTCCLGAASLALFAAARQEIHTRPGRFGSWGLLIIGIAYFCVGIFSPDPKWFVGSLLHGIGGLVVILRVAHGVHAGEQGPRAQRGVGNGRTTADLDGHFDMAESGVFLRVHCRFPWYAALWQASLSGGQTES